MNRSSLKLLCCQVITSQHVEIRILPWKIHFIFNCVDVCVSVIGDVHLNVDTHLSQHEAISSLLLFNKGHIFTKDVWAEKI